MKNNKKRYSILIGGDFCPTGIIDECFINKENIEDNFSGLFSLLKESEFSIINLECPIISNPSEINSIKKVGPSLSASKDSLQVLANNRLSAVTLANNHILDYGLEGLKQTITSLDSANIKHVGAGLSKKKLREPLQVNIDGFKISILNFAENEFSTLDDSFGANAISTIDNYNDILDSKNKSDFVFAIIHSGHEEYQLPSPWMQKQFRFYIDAGCDAIFTHHTHCYSGYEIYNDKHIFYGLGNLSFYWEGLNNGTSWNFGYMVGVNFSNTKKLSFNIIPYEQGTSKHNGIHILDTESLKYKNIMSDISRLNHIIKDPDLVLKNFKLLAIKRTGVIMSYFTPYNNRFLNFLAYKNLIPKFCNNQKKRLLLNLFRCEAHKNISIEVLKTIIK